VTTQGQEVTELRALAADWQRQFHTLKDAVEKVGITVSYGENGQPTIRMAGCEFPSCACVDGCRLGYIGRVEV
jgi:hypothetical protein